MLRPFIVKLSVLGYFPLHYISFILVGFDCSTTIEKFHILGPTLNYLSTFSKSFIETN